MEDKIWLKTLEWSWSGQVFGNRALRGVVGSAAGTCPATAPPRPLLVASATGTKAKAAVCACTRAPDATNLKSPLHRVCQCCLASSSLPAAAAARSGARGMSTTNTTTASQQVRTLYAATVTDSLSFDWE